MFTPYWNSLSLILQTRNHYRQIPVRQYLVGIKSYFAYYDIDVIPSKFKRKVKLPKRLQEDQEPIDAEDIRNILLNCNNRRLKTFILVLASGAMRIYRSFSN